MSKRKGWDLTSHRSCQSAAEWMRKNAQGAPVLALLVVRQDDCVFAVDSEIAPSAARQMVELVLPEVEQELATMRLEAKARVKAKRLGAM